MYLDRLLEDCFKKEFEPMNYFRETALAASEKLIIMKGKRYDERVLLSESEKKYKIYCLLDMKASDCDLAIDYVHMGTFVCDQM